MLYLVHATHELKWNDMPAGTTLALAEEDPDADLCRVLDLGSPHKVADRVDPDARNQTPVIDSMGRTQQATVVSWVRPRESAMG